MLSVPAVDGSYNTADRAQRWQDAILEAVAKACCAGTPPQPSGRTSDAWSRLRVRASSLLQRKSRVLVPTPGISRSAGAPEERATPALLFA